MRSNRYIYGTCRQVRLLLAAGIVAAGIACENSPELPPEQKSENSQSAPEMDFSHSATLGGGEQVSVPNIKLILLQTDLDGTLAGIALRSVPPGLDGSTLRFDKLRAMTLKQLTEKPIILLGAGVLDKSGNGVFAPTKAYQPKFAEVRLSELTDTEARGTISGEFYVFRLGTGVVVPDVRKLDIEFRAVVVVQ